VLVSIQDAPGLFACAPPRLLALGTRSVISAPVLDWSARIL
jgi:hypothetical protein